MTLPLIYYLYSVGRVSIIIKKESLMKEVFTLCQIGKRSEIASKILIKLKIPSQSIEGGIEKINQIELS